jgi:hypothetical protein
VLIIVFVFQSATNFCDSTNAANSRIVFAAGRQEREMSEFALEVENVEKVYELRGFLGMRNSSAVFIRVICNCRAKFAAAVKEGQTEKI